MTPELYVGGLPHTVTGSHLANLFAQHGTVNRHACSPIGLPANPVALALSKCRHQRKLRLRFGLEWISHERPDRRQFEADGTDVHVGGLCAHYDDTLALPAYAKDKSGVLKATDLLKMKVQGTDGKSLGRVIMTMPYSILEDLPGPEISTLRCPGKPFIYEFYGVPLPDDQKSKDDTKPSK